MFYTLNVWQKRPNFCFHRTNRFLIANRISAFFCFCWCVSYSAFLLLPYSLPWRVDFLRQQPWSGTSSVYTKSREELWTRDDFRTLALGVSAFSKRILLLSSHVTTFSRKTHMNGRTGEKLAISLSAVSYACSFFFLHTALARVSNFVYASKSVKTLRICSPKISCDRRSRTVPHWDESLQGVKKQLFFFETFIDLPSANFQWESNWFSRINFHVSSTTTCN